MARKKVSIQEFLKLPDGPVHRLKRIQASFNDLSNELARELGWEVVKIAKQYVSGERDGGFAPLWEKERKLYGWTPEFNKESRVSNRNDDTPLSDTGALHDAITVLGQTRTKKSGSLSSVGVEGEQAEKAWMLEKGGVNNWGKTVPARPFLSTAVEDAQTDSDVTEAMQARLDEFMARIGKGKSKSKRKSK